MKLMSFPIFLLALLSQTGCATDDEPFNSLLTAFIVHDIETYPCRLAMQYREDRDDWPASAKELKAFDSENSYWNAISDLMIEPRGDRLAVRYTCDTEVSFDVVIEPASDATSGVDRYHKNRAYRILGSTTRPGGTATLSQWANARGVFIHEPVATQ